MTLADFDPSDPCSPSGIRKVGQFFVNADGTAFLAVSDFTPEQLREIARLIEEEISSAFRLSGHCDEPPQISSLT